MRSKNVRDMSIGNGRVVCICDDGVAPIKSLRPSDAYMRQ